jgi:hypothetical protein
MIRRHRPQRETTFSFDSFLDLVTNIVGIIIRLILIVWVSARSYTPVLESFRPTPPPAGATDLIIPKDPLQHELERQRVELAEAQKRLLTQMQQLDLTQATDKHAELELADLDARRQALHQTSGELQRTAAERGKVGEATVVTLADIQQRRERIAEEIKALEKLPPLKKVLRYRTPVSKVVSSEEFNFECQQGRVSFVDVKRLTDEVHRHFRDKEEELKTQWQVRDVTETIGAFRMHYLIERQRSMTDSVFGAVTPEARSSFGYGLSEWIIEPMAPFRGESIDEALQPNSEFRHVCDGLSPELSAVTMWVYPDSFELYRRLRDFLADRKITVAGRPIPPGVPIQGSRHGSVSRGQ